MSAVPPGPYLTLKEVMEKYRVKKTTWYKGMKDGIYPNRIRSSRRKVMWSESEIEKSLEALNLASDKKV